MIKWVFRIVILVVVIAIGAYAYLAISTSAGCQGNEVVQEEKGAPATSVAPFTVQTTSRVYYAVDVKETDKTVSLHGFFEKVNKKWVLRDGDLILNRSAYGKITVIRR